MLKRNWISTDEADAALCLWEECIMRQVMWKREHGMSEEGPPLFDWLRGGEGCASARDMCVDLANDLDLCYRIAHHELGFDDSFDWEFVPRWADYAMELTEDHFLDWPWHKWIAYKVTEDWKRDTKF